jgi:hypothetical protein
MNPVYLPYLRHPGYDPKRETQVIKEIFFTWNDRPFLEEWREKNIVLEGYWQTEKYFKHWRERLLHSFGFGWSHRPGVVSVHVRRGDYLKWTRKHPPVPASWIQKAMDQFPGYRFLFFSDDIAWCRKVFGWQKDIVSFSEGNTEVKDLVAMSCCEHHICSASTFSWWGAWMDQNPTKRVIIPKLWFVEGWGGHDTKDVVPKEWEKL